LLIISAKTSEKKKKKNSKPTNSHKKKQNPKMSDAPPWQSKPREVPTYRDGSARELDPHRVGRLQRDLISYYQRVERMLARAPDEHRAADGAAAEAGGAAAADDGSSSVTGTERALFIENTWAEALEDIGTAACHVYCSKVVERLLEESTPRQCAAFLEAVAPTASKYMASQYGCHVMETAMTVAPWLVEKEAAEHAEWERRMALEKEEDRPKVCVLPRAVRCSYF
jgi:hypothetical protein